MATVGKPARPLSPHLTHYRWGPHMTVSILHRVTGDGMATVGTILFVWWLAALAGGAESYNYFWSWFTQGYWKVLGYVVGGGLSWAFFQHLLSGLRHLTMDIGASYELNASKRSAALTFVGSVLLTAGFWAWQLRDLYLGGK